VALEQAIQALKRAPNISTDIDVTDGLIKDLQLGFSDSINAISTVFNAIDFYKILKLILMLQAPFLIIFFLSKFINGISIGTPSEYIKMIDSDPSFNPDILSPDLNTVLSEYPTNHDKSVAEIIYYIKDKYALTDNECMQFAFLMDSSDRKIPLEYFEDYAENIVVNASKISSTTGFNVGSSITNNSRITKTVIGGFRVY
jgi:hypothetical protein